MGGFLYSRSISPSRKKPRGGLEVQLSRCTATHLFSLTRHINSATKELPARGRGTTNSSVGSCTPRELNRCSRAHWKERSPSTQRRSRHSAGPKALRPPLSPSFSLHPLRWPRALFPRPPRRAAPLTRLSRLLQPPLLLTQTLCSWCAAPLTIHTSHWAALLPEATNQSRQRRARALEPAC